MAGPRASPPSGTHAHQLVAESSCQTFTAISCRRRERAIEQPDDGEQHDAGIDEFDRPGGIRRMLGRPAKT